MCPARPCPHEPFDPFPDEQVFREPGEKQDERAGCFRHPFSELEITLQGPALALSTAPGMQDGQMFLPVMACPHEDLPRLPSEIRRNGQPDRAIMARRVLQLPQTELGHVRPVIRGRNRDDDPRIRDGPRDVLRKIRALPVREHVHTAVAAQQLPGGIVRPGAIP